MDELDRQLKELNAYSPEMSVNPQLLQQFWHDQLETFNHKPLNMQRKQADSPFPYAKVYEIQFEGFDQTPLYGWYLVPSFVHGKMPCVVVYQGYTSGRGYPERYAHWLMLGYCVLALDVRGQGGQTGNQLTSSEGMTKGWISQGILQKETSYYMAIIIDALKAVDAASVQPETDVEAIVLHGGSQGGGLVMAVAALSNKAICAIADIPNMCHMNYGIFNSIGSLKELAEFANVYPEKLNLILENLSYFDNMNLADRIRIPILVSVGLKDEICLPKTIFAAYNRIEAPKEIKVYPFLGHSVNEYQKRESINFMKKCLKK
jgi:cephalosporin-C deacetylase